MATSLGLNYNYYTAGKTPPKSKSTTLARVDKIIMGPTDAAGNLDPDFEKNGRWASIGGIYFTVVFGDESLISKVQNRPVAYPKASSTKHFPVKGEIVEITTGPSPSLNESANSTPMLYYSIPFNLWNTVHHNSFPNPVDYSNTVTTQNTGYEAATQGAVYSSVTESTAYPLGIPEKSTIKDLHPYEGDIHFQGRFGQSIRFGSTVKHDGSPNPWSLAGDQGDPIVIIRSGQGPQLIQDAWVNSIEDINSDPASIYLCAGQKILIQDLNNYNLASFASRDKLTPSNTQERQKQPMSTDSTSPKTQSDRELASAQTSQNVNYGKS